MNVSFLPDRREGPTFWGLTQRSYWAAQSATIRELNGGHSATNLRITASSAAFFVTRAYRFLAWAQNAPPSICNLSTNSETLPGTFSVPPANSLSNAGFASSYTLSKVLSLARASSRSCSANSSLKSSRLAISVSALRNLTSTSLQSNGAGCSKRATIFRMMWCWASRQSPDDRSRLQMSSCFRLRSPQVVAIISDTLVNVNRIWKPDLRPAIKAAKSGSSTRQFVPPILLVSNVRAGLYSKTNLSSRQHSTTSTYRGLRAL
jgi:hypothetical protein